MSKENFILHEIFDKSLFQDEFEIAKNEYLKSLKNNKYTIEKAENIYELIQNIKRSPRNIGPYRNISVFEALNRIGTDLVLLAGVEKLFNNEISTITPKNIKLNMGTTHGFDFIVDTKDNQKINGEAFNAAESFCKYKLRQAIHKFAGHKNQNNFKSAIVFINEEVRSFLLEYKNKKEELLKNDNIVIHKIFCNTINLML